MSLSQQHSDGGKYSDDDPRAFSVYISGTCKTNWHHFTRVIFRGLFGLKGKRPCVFDVILSCARPWHITHSKWGLWPLLEWLATSPPWTGCNQVTIRTPPHGFVKRARASLFCSRRKDTGRTLVAGSKCATLIRGLGVVPMKPLRCLGLQHSLNNMQKV